jgi:polyisoprenyl-phosphate glycosyltransferase
MSAGSSAEPIAASNSDASISEKVWALQGPVRILGATGFARANLMRLRARLCPDVCGTTRLPGGSKTLLRDRVKVVDLLADFNLDQLLDTIKPRTIFDCVA